MLAINLCQSDVSTSLGLKKIENLNLNSLYFENIMNVVIDGVHQREINNDCPLKSWNLYVANMTSISAETDLIPAYNVLVKLANANDLGGALSQDKLRFPSAAASC